MGVNKKMICQSCGMPIKKEEDFGTERGGSKSRFYCKYCFENGRFKDEGITLQEKIDELTKITVNQLGMTQEQARIMAETKLPSLMRWKTGE